uniref:GOST seven transmembrane domain-containing protein n=1 Tax=Zooxanthella nutricula TaxID=1333877 RepID=A0A7S2I0L6_9DINO|mmetsp:Transcript_1295/g.3719  ORF Transcript_1295/g.3719 Transcript_1295/m.3719 type:complete len:498 (+) Transcript_1295:41-1534(+)
MSPPTTARPVLASLVLALGARRAAAQVFRFDDVDVPAPQTLQTHVMYYIRSLTGSGSQARGKVTFDLTQVEGAGASQKYSGLQALVMSRSSFDTWAAKEAQCSTATSTGSADKQGTPEAGTLLLDKIPGPPPVSYAIKGPKESTSLTVDLPQSKSEVYVLVFSNCGSVDHEGIKVVGTVSVRNAHGYLPAHDYPKRVFYAVMVVCYTVASFVWAVAAIKWWSTLLYIQKGILFVGILGLIENLSFLILYEVWNQSGIYSVAISMVATLCYAWKLGVAFQVLLVQVVFDPAVGSAAEGENDTWANCKLSVAVALYMIAEFNAKVVQSYRLSRDLKLDTILLNYAPVVVMSLVLYAWANVALISTTAALKERGEKHASALFHSHVLVIISMIGGGLALAVELFDPTSRDPDSWSLHWVWADGVRQIAFLVLFAGAQAVWFPSDETLGYTYQAAEGAQPEETIGAVLDGKWDDVDDPEEPEEGSSLQGARVVEPAVKAGE